MRVFGPMGEGGEKREGGGEGVERPVKDLPVGEERRLVIEENGFW
jgi:hypothetical protein